MKSTAPPATSDRLPRRLEEVPSLDEAKRWAKRRTDEREPDHVRESLIGQGFSIISITSNGVLHLIDDERPGGHGYIWPLCSRWASDVQAVDVTDPRRLCRTCVLGVPRAIEMREWRSQERAKRERAEEKRRKEHEECMASLKAMGDLLDEQRRRRDICRGIDPDNKPRKTAAHIRAEAVALRAQNDQALAELREALTTSD